MRRRGLREQPPAPPNSTGLRDRVEQLQKEALVIRGVAMSLATRTADHAAAAAELAEDLKKVGL